MPPNYYQGLEEDLPDKSAESASTQTTLIPKSLVGDDVEVGDTIEFKVVHLYEDEVEVELGDAGESESEPEDESMPMSPEDEIGMMAQG